MQSKIFDYKSPDFEKLIMFGFTAEGKNYSYVTEILGGQFELRVDISADNAIKTQVIDTATDEPYTLHLVEEAGGTFVGAVRAEYERVLTEIAEECFKSDVFKEGIAHKVIEYVRGKYGDELEFLWSSSPSSAIWRRKDSKKWYGVMLIVSKRKLGLDCDESVTVIDLRVDREELKSLADGKRYFPGYHMNKKSWLTMCLDGSVPAEEICAWIDKSYNLAK